MKFRPQSTYARRLETFIVHKLTGGRFYRRTFGVELAGVVTLRI
jgi:hypothetical protein